MLTPEITVILFTRGLPYVQCTNNCLTCENDTANYKILQEHQLNSRRVSGVGDTLYNDLVLLYDTSAKIKDAKALNCKAKAL